MSWIFLACVDIALRAISLQFISLCFFTYVYYVISHLNIFRCKKIYKFLHYDAHNLTLKKSEKRF